MPEILILASIRDKKHNNNHYGGYIFIYLNIVPLRFKKAQLLAVAKDFTQYGQSR